MNVFSAKLISVGRLLPNPLWRMKMHFHPFHEMIVIIRGKMKVLIAGQRVVASTGDVLLYPATVPHEEEADYRDPVESCFFGFTLGEIKARTLVMCHDDSARMRQIIRWMYDDQKASNLLARKEREVLTHAFLAEFFRAQTERGSNEIVDKIRGYIRAHAGEPLTLDTLAREAGLSKYYFLRAYRRLTGRTPMADVRAIRADYARDLLLTTSLTIKEIAPKAGLGNEYSMSRVFRKVFAMPPGEFRRHPGR